MSIDKKSYFKCKFLEKIFHLETLPHKSQVMCCSQYFSDLDLFSGKEPFLDKIFMLSMIFAGLMVTFVIINLCFFIKVFCENKTTPRNEFASEMNRSAFVIHPRYRIIN